MLVDVVLSTFATILAYLFVLSMVGRLDMSELASATVCGAFVSSFILFFISSLNRESIRHFTIANVIGVIALVVVKEFVVVLVAWCVMGGVYRLPMYISIVDFLLTIFFLIGMRSAMSALYYYIIDLVRRDVMDVFIYSTRGYNPTLVQHMNRDINSRYRIRGFLTTNRSKVGNRLSGERVYFVGCSVAEQRELFCSQGIESVIFTSQESVDRERNNLVEFCIHNNIKMLIAGDIQQLDENGEIPNRSIKPIQIEDLLERQEINVDFAKISSQIEGRVVLVTGAAGSIGSEIARQVATYGVKRLILYDIAETPLHNIQMEFSKRFADVAIEYILADVRSEDRARQIIGRYKPSIIFHAAAYKHVPMVEANPCEGVIVNVWGTVNIAQRAIESGVEKFVMISTDKAINPTNVMGASKRIAEMCVQSMNREGKTEFITTRFGNVLGSNGSVIPHFKSLIAAGGPVTVTHPEIIRYFMTIPEACRLVLQAATMGHAGEILVFDMGEPVKIVDLARKMIRISGFEPDRDIKIVYTGLRPGEKLYEELLSSDENCVATQHRKIRIAQSIVPDIAKLEPQIRALMLSARRVEVEQTVRVMKQIVPEFRSNNSIYEKFDQ